MANWLDNFEGGNEPSNKQTTPYNFNVITNTPNSSL
jgi:hypothetical protein